VAEEADRREIGAVEGPRGRSPLAQVSDAMVRIYKDHFGRGPTKVRSAYAGPDVVVCILEDTLTTAEMTLRELGELRRLRELRMVFQYALDDQFKTAVEEILERNVTAFISGMDAKTGVASEVFVLEPETPRVTRPA
jgi:uncharacterized protein YbcI